MSTESTARRLCASSIAAFAAAALVAVLALAAPRQALAVEIHQASSVVELFTSQGCSSCPPADRVLRDLSRENDVLALAWHVDYWDYLGWKDTFANPENTRRQQAYAASLGKSGVYTPQAIINGRKDVVGSRGLAVREVMQTMRSRNLAPTVPISAAVSNGMLKVSVDATEAAADTTLWMVYYTDEVKVEVLRGENAGRELGYANVVRDIEMIGMVKDRMLQTEFRLKGLGQRGYDSCALILQKTNDDGSPGPIVGAAIIRGLRK